VGQATPSDLIGTAERPRRMVGDQMDQAVAPAFLEVGGIRAGDPVFGAFPAHSELLEREATGLATDLAWGEFSRKADLRGQCSCLHTGRSAKGAWVLVQEGAQALPPRRVENGPRSVRLV
jgi:hypothetical protein